VLIGGRFDTVNGQQRANFARLAADGTLDSSFAPAVGYSIDTPLVDAIALQADGKILVGGSFDNLAGRTRNRIGRLCVDGSLDDTLNAGADGEVAALALQADGKILVGGGFTMLAGQPRDSIGRLNPDGTLDMSFNPGATKNFGAFVNNLVVQPDGKILIGGWFTTLAGQPGYNIGRLNADGMLDGSFRGAADHIVYCLALQNDGKIIVGGSFTFLNEPRDRIGRLNPDGTLDRNFNPGANGPVFCLAVQPDGKILVGGQFTRLAGQPRNYLGRLNPDGSLDPNFDPAPDFWIHCLAVQPDGKILVGGSFRSIAGVSRTNLARLEDNGGVDAAFDASANSFVDSLALQADGRIVVGGFFNLLAGQPRSSIGRLDSTGRLDASFRPEADHVVRSLALQRDGKVLAGGNFSRAGGQSRQRIARLTSGSAAQEVFELSGCGTGVQWRLSGAGPRLQDVTFDLSRDGINYTLLGSALGGSALGDSLWYLYNLSLPIGENFFVRARGRAVAGYGNGSGHVVESVASFYVSPPPVIHPTRLPNGTFRFTFRSHKVPFLWAVFASTDVTLPLQRWNLIGNAVPIGCGFYEFTDLTAPAFPHRFYCVICD
jgi:uncharacterized delta-60 repeat protein